MYWLTKIEGMGRKVFFYITIQKTNMLFFRENVAVFKNYNVKNKIIVKLIDRIRNLNYF